MKNYDRQNTNETHNVCFTKKSLPPFTPQTMENGINAKALFDVIENLS